MRTKHVDVKYHFIQDLIKDDYLDIVYVKSEDNYADLMTKNVSKDVYDRLLVSGIQDGHIETKRENVGLMSVWKGQPDAQVCFGSNGHESGVCGSCNKDWVRDERIRSNAGRTE